MGTLAKAIATLFGTVARSFTTTVTRRRNVRAIRAAFARWSAGKGSLFDLMLDDALIIIPGSQPHCGTFIKDAFLRDVAMPFMARFRTPPRPRARTIWCEGNDVAVLADAVGTTLQDQPYANTYVFILTMRRGCIVQALEFLDMAAFNDVWDRVVPAPAGTAGAR